MLSLIIFITIFLSAMGDWSSKMYSLHPTWNWMVLTVTIYVSSTVFWLQMMTRMNSLIQAGKIWTVGATIAMLFTSQFIFHEPITFKQWIGVGLGFISLMLLL